MLVLERDVVQDHVHARKVVCRMGKLLPVELDAVAAVLVDVVARLQQERAGAHARVVDGEAGLSFPALRHDARDERRDALGRIELPRLLSGFRSELADEVLIGVSEGIRAVLGEVDAGKGLHDLGEHLVALLGRRSKALGIDVEILEEVLVELLALVRAATLLDIAHGLPEMVRRKRLVIDLVVEGSQYHHS